MLQFDLSDVRRLIPEGGQALKDQLFKHISGQDGSDHLLSVHDSRS